MTPDLSTLPAIELAKRLAEKAEALRQYKPRPFISFDEIDALCKKETEKK